VIFHEKLDLKFDVEAMQEGIEQIQQKVGKRTGLGANDSGFGGWSLQSHNNDWRSGFEDGGYRESADGSLVQKVKMPPIYEYHRRTEACIDIFANIIDELEEKGFYPYRSRITVLDPGQSTVWHTDAMDGYYSVRLHIPIITNSECEFEVQNEGAVHMPADGHAHLVDVSTTHRAYNRGSETRMHFLAQVFPTVYSENFIVTESRKDILAFYAMTGHRVYQKVMDEKAKAKS
jgi:hypothetical protein